MSLQRAAATTLSILLSIVSVSTASPDSEKLRRATFFAVGGIGERRDMSEGERSLRALLRQSDAQEELAELLGSASPAGQMYALVGLRVRDRDAFDRALSGFAMREDIVSTVTGCFGFDERVRVVAHRIAQGDYDKAMARSP
jgi:hypothetical protein